MNRKLLALLSASILTLATSATFAAGDTDTTNANSTPPTTQGAGKEKRQEALQRFRAALEQLNLSPEQKEKIKTIFTDARTKLQALKGQTDAKQQAVAIIKQVRQDIMAVLDDAQKAKLKEILADDRAESKT